MCYTFEIMEISYTTSNARRFTQRKLPIRWQRSVSKHVPPRSPPSSTTKEENDVVFGICSAEGVGDLFKPKWMRRSGRLKQRVSKVK